MTITLQPGESVTLEIPLPKDIPLTKTTYWHESDARRHRAKLRVFDVKNGRFDADITESRRLTWRGFKPVWSVHPYFVPVEEKQHDN